MLLNTWAKRVGLSRVTAWHYSKTGRIKIIYRYGRPYITAESIAEFFTDDGSKRPGPKRRAAVPSPALPRGLAA